MSIFSAGGGVESSASFNGALRSTSTAAGDEEAAAAAGDEDAAAVAVGVPSGDGINVATSSGACAILSAAAVDVAVLNVENVTVGNFGVVVTAFLNTEEDAVVNMLVLLLVLLVLVLLLDAFMTFLALPGAENGMM